ncbi:MAG: hybrid sensor histidine kinase/response regulator [Proteobacteria bacterium]|nr:hybrid sensor histidine kinase/response regulator [Pseudomonadota bacterium]MBU4294649.1 hybrid sensor histidine kinase/response regulator [Pseudomonadota bacterium]MCG2748884.1 hybrid sensor histidine kinase/response regulator [Desulfobulbaceae bacterium]
MIEDQEMFQLFKVESTEHLARLDDGLLRLEKTPADQSLLEEVFRESHSLKGAARMLGLARVEATAHGLETILNSARKGEAPLTPETIAHMNAGLDDLRQRVQEALSNVASGMRHAECGVKSEAGADEGMEGMKSAVSQTEIPHSPLPTPQSNIPQSALPIPHSNTPQSALPFRIETVRVETRKLDDLLTQVGELSVVQGRVQHRLGLMEELLAQWTTLERDRRKRSPITRLRHGAEAGEDGGAALRFGGLLKQARDTFFDDSARLESIGKLLEDQVRSIRLLPLSTVFALFPRTVRDLAMEQGKEAELVLEGGDITVDKRILEEMKDPLMHLIRNAIDHGIESPAEREQLGKPRHGMVRLRAVRDNAYVRLEVQDDGRGLDPAAIRQEAKKRGLHDEAALAAMTAAQVQQLVLMPGFSTSTYVTELSGRGVGLDVVRVNVEHMKGSIRLESATGQGLTVQLRLPLSVTATRLLLASVGGRLYGLPVEFVHTSRRVREADVFTLEGRCAVMLDGQPVIIARLTDLLELPGEERPATPDIMACIVLQVGDERLGLLADDLPAEEEVIPKPLGAPLTRVRNVSALAMLGSGEICPVLNPADLLRTSRMRNSEFGVRSVSNAELGLRSADSIPHSAIRNPTSILLVEDSALIRAMEKRILEDGGYEVVTAVDGVDGLNSLDSRPFAAVVSDIMMPNMDGLALTARIRAEPRYQDMPVILVTSLASDEDKRRGLDAGANAYIPKPSFDQRILLDTLKRLI